MGLRKDLAGKESDVALREEDRVESRAERLRMAKDKLPKDARALVNSGQKVEPESREEMPEGESQDEEAGGMDR